MSQFVHLHVHTEFSIHDSIVRIKTLLERVVALKQPAIAITDTHNLFGSIKFYRAAIALGIKPIIGSEITVRHASGKTSQLILLCQNNAGYLNLTKLLSKCHLESAHEHAAQACETWLATHSDGLIAITGSMQSNIAYAIQNKKKSRAIAHIETWKKLFPGRLYLQIQKTGTEKDPNHLHQLVTCANESSTPMVASNDVRFLHTSDFEAHEVRVCIQNSQTLNDPNRPKRYTEQQYLKSSEDMATLFASLPQAIENTITIAKRCNLTLTLDQHFLPNYPVKDSRCPHQYCTQMVESRLQHYASQQAFTTETLELYQTRLAYEMKVIKEMGFTSYFLIVADFIAWAKDNDVPVGPGRGSGAGSLVAFMLKITGIDPMVHGLIFERFLNPERVSMPDFDIDFCMEGRDRVIDYVAKKYGHACVAQIITYGTMAAKAVIRDVGRVMGLGYGFVDAIAKLIPFELGMTLKKALATEALLLERYQQEEEVKTLIDMGGKLEGIIRNAGKHAGGVIIAPKPLTEFTALYCDNDPEHPVTHLDKDDIEQIGLIKFDFLGLRTLTIINWAVQTINQKNGLIDENVFNIESIALNDKKTFSLLKSQQTTAVFQLESRGMKDLIKRLQPDTFEQITALVALFRPGPLQSGMVDDYIDRKHGRASANYFHESLKEILEPTYGIILYQEQVMKIAQVLSNYSLGSADLLRRAMGKKKLEEMAKQRKSFIDGAMDNRIDEHKAGTIFDIIEKFAGYGFNKSHSAAYAMIAYQTAYLKTHHPIAYMAAVLSADMEHSDKVSVMIDECRRMKLTILAPSINASSYRFSLQGDNIQYGLGAIKGVGEAAINLMITERNNNGLYENLADFCTRCNKQKVNKRAIEAMIKAGAMDCFDCKRSGMLANLNHAMKHAEQAQHNLHTGQNDLFGNDVSPQAIKPTNDSNDFDPFTLLHHEKEALGLYLSGHPMDYYQKELNKINICSIDQVSATTKHTTIVAGIVHSFRNILTKRGDRMTVLTLSNKKASIDISVFHELREQKQQLIANDQLLIIKGEVSTDRMTQQPKMLAKEIFSIDDVRQKHATQIHITFATHHNPIEKIANLLKHHQDGTCQVKITLPFGHAKASFMCGPDWHVTATDQLLQSLRSMDEVDYADVEYG